MDNNKLWAVSALGNVYTLAKNSEEWTQVPSKGLILSGFKKISTAPQCVWGLACDHQVFVYVPSSDLPIRCQESTFENEVMSILRTSLRNIQVYCIIVGLWFYNDPCELVA